MLFLCDFNATISLCFCKNLLELCNEYLCHLLFAHQLSKFGKRLYMVYFLQYLVAPKTFVSNCCVNFQGTFLLHNISRNMAVVKFKLRMWIYYGGSLCQFMIFCFWLKLC